MLDKFFKVNLPYGLIKNDKNEWAVFNREYQPLGFTIREHESVTQGSFDHLPIRAKYNRLTEKVLLEIAFDTERGIHRNEEGEIYQVYLYNDGTNPVNIDEDKLWDDYFKRLKKLSKLSLKEYPIVINYTCCAF